MEIINEKSWLEGLPFVSQFQEVYRDLEGFSAFVALAKGGETADPDRTSLVLLRSFIETNKRAKEDQKYVVGIRFYGFGDMATIDLISLDQSYHRDMAYGHAKRLGWLTEEVINNDKFGATYGVPLLFAGGHLKIDSSGMVTFWGSSGDYDRNMLGWDINEVAYSLVNFCGISVQENTTKGQKFFEDILEFTLKHKLRNDFYEQFIERNASCKLTGQQLGALVTMKVTDRVVGEGVDFLETLVQEITGNHWLARLVLKN